MEIDNEGKLNKLYIKSIWNVVYFFFSNLAYHLSGTCTKHDIQMSNMLEYIKKGTWLFKWMDGNFWLAKSYGNLRVHPVAVIKLIYSKANLIDRKMTARLTKSTAKWGRRQDHSIIHSKKEREIDWEVWRVGDKFAEFPENIACYLRTECLSGGNGSLMRYFCSKLN